MVIGEADPFLGSKLADCLAEYCSNLHTARLPDVGHWVHYQAPDELVRVMREFLPDLGWPV